MTGNPPPAHPRAVCLRCGNTWDRPADKPWAKLCLECWRKGQAERAATGETSARSTYRPDPPPPTAPPPAARGSGWQTGEWGAVGAGWKQRVEQPATPAPTPPPATAPTPHPGWTRRAPASPAPPQATPPTAPPSPQDGQGDAGEVEALRGEVERLRAEAGRWRDRFDAAALRADAAEADAAEQREAAKDAERREGRACKAQLDAAREVARLRAEIDTLRASLGVSEAMVGTLRAENAILRQAAKNRTAAPAAPPLSAKEYRALQFAIHPDRTPDAEERNRAMAILNQHRDRLVAPKG